MNFVRIGLYTVICIFMLFGSANAFIVINEVELNPPGSYDTDEWVELYNTGEFPEDISGYTITDGKGTADAVPDGTVIGAGEFFVFTENISSLSLDNTNEFITLKDALGQIVDVTPAFDDTANNQSTWQRVPDGADNWEFKEGTEGGGNGGEGEGGGIPEFPAFIVPLLLVFASVSVAGRLGYYN